VIALLDTVNQHVAKTLLAVEDGDSINRVSQKIGSSYGCTHNWVERLVGITNYLIIDIITDALHLVNIESYANTYKERSVKLHSV
jgi:hypothetical protein